MTARYLRTPGGLEVVELRGVRQVVLQRLPGEEFVVVPQQVVDDFLETVSTLRQVKVEEGVL